MKYLNIFRNKIAIKRVSKSFAPTEKKRCGESGFSLIEVTIALIILLIVLLGVFATFVYAINYNSGNNARSQGLTVLQQYVEEIRSAKFVPTYPYADEKLTSTGGEKNYSANSQDGNKFKVKIIVDDDPFTSGIQKNDTTTMKEVSVTVALDSPTPGWQTALPTTVVMRRVRAN